MHGPCLICLQSAAPESGLIGHPCYRNWKFNNIFLKSQNNPAPNTYPINITAIIRSNLRLCLQRHSLKCSQRRNLKCLQRHNIKCLQTHSLKYLQRHNLKYLQRYNLTSDIPHPKKPSSKSLLYHECQIRSPSHPPQHVSLIFYTV